MKRKNMKQRGLFGGASETQMLVTGISVIGVIVMGVAFALLERAKAQSEWEIVNSLMSATRDLYNGEVYPSGSLSANLISAQKTGAAKTNGSNTIYNNYGAIIAPVGSGGTFTLTDNSVDLPGCIFILKQIPSTGTTQVSVNGGSAITNFPISVSTAITNCTAGAAIAITAQ